MFSFMLHHTLRRLVEDVDYMEGYNIHFLTKFFT